MSTNDNFDHSIIFHNIPNWIHKKSLVEQLLQLILPLIIHTVSLHNETVHLRKTLKQKQVVR